MVTHASFPSAEFISPLTSADKLILHEYDERITAASKSYRISRCEIAFFGWRIKKYSLWSEFGCSSEDEYRASRGITQSNWDSCLLVGRLLEPLSLEQLVSIGIDKGRLLSTVHSDLWCDYDWLSDARKMSTIDLRDIIRMRNRTMDDPAVLEALLKAQSDNAISRTQIAHLKRKYNLDAEDAIAMALRDADSSAVLELAKAVRHATKLLTLASKSVTYPMKASRNQAPWPYQIREDNARRLIEKAKARMNDALACAAGIQLTK